MNEKKQILGGSLLVAGTAIGAGMLALPVASATGGFFPALVVYFICWIFSFSTGLLMLEAILKMPGDTNLISMSKHYLGRKGKIASWILYIFLFYLLTLAYVTAGGGIFASFFPKSTPLAIPTLLFAGVFGSIVYMGAKAVDRVNVFLMAGLILSYFVFVTIGFDRVQFSMLKRADWLGAFGALPIIFTSFSYQGLIPSLTTYLKRNVKVIRLCIFFGSLIPFIAYVAWDLLIKGIVPVEGSHGLLAVQNSGQTAVEPLKYFIQSPYIYLAGQFFAFFALTTSFFGVTLPLVDFLADGLKVKKTGMSRVGLVCLVYIPTVIISLINPTIFFKALNLAGGIGCVFLLGLIPIMMVWNGRYRMKDKIEKPILIGGKPYLVFLLLFIAVELVFMLRAIF